MRPAHPRDLLAIASGVLLLIGAVSAAGSLRDWVRTPSLPAIAAVPAKSSQDLAFAKHARLPAEPQAPAAGAASKPVPQASAKKHASTAGVPQAEEISPGNPVSDRLPLP
jgi:hypothetical protein